MTDVAHPPGGRQVEFPRGGGWGIYTSAVYRATDAASAYPEIELLSRLRSESLARFSLKLKEKHALWCENCCFRGSQATWHFLSDERYTLAEGWSTAGFCPGGSPAGIWWE